MIVAAGSALNKEAFLELEKDYEAFLDEIGRDRRTAEIIKEHAELEAFYLNNLDKGISILEGLLQIPSLNKYTEANSKLLLGDFYLIKGEIWDATLLYSQVDKDFMEDLLGERARFKNAKLSYFNGEFEWAQIQFDALKASTSKLISNDAMDLSVFIMDNLGLDSTDEAMRLYAGAELLSFQNKHEEAFASLGELEMKFTDHTLIDDIKYLKADIYNAKGEFEKAADLYTDILENHKDEIRADNALFKLARLYETALADKSKAMELYETLFVDFSNSTFAVESRKRFRYLRGDKLSTEELFMMGIKL